MSLAADGAGPPRGWTGQWRLLTPADRALILLVAAAAVTGFSVEYGSGRGAVAATVVVQGEGWGRYPAGTVRILEVPGPLGVTLVELGPAGARVKASPCANQLCVRQGWVGRVGGVVACVPNRVVVTLLGEAAADAPDAVSR